MRYTYSQSGVDVLRNDEFTDYIKNLLKEINMPDWVVREPTGYATILIFTNPPIVLTADGVGSKLLLHIEYGRWNDAAQDLIAMNYNDIICVGGLPKAFVDYLGVNHIDKVHYEFLSALARKLNEYNISLVAGETAEIPAIYTEKDWDVAGFCVGTLERRIPVESINYGDKIIGLRASGFHSNGWSLLRKIINEEGININSLNFDLLVGTNIYGNVPAVFEDVKGIAHVTGGGILRALKRVLRDKGWDINIKMPDYMQWVLQYVEIEEAMRTFNMGYGMILIADASKTDKILRITGGDIIGEVSNNTTIVVE